MMGKPVQDALVAWLRSSAPWGEAPEVIETHAAMVFLAGERAFKLKKPVNLGYLNFEAVEARQQALSRELELNRRTAPDYYLRLVAIVKAGAGFAIGGAGDAVDWLLEMKRFPRGSLLSDRATQHTLPEDTIERLAVRLAQFHDGEPTIANVDWVSALKRVSEENFADLLSIRPSFDAKVTAEWRAMRTAAWNMAAVGLLRESSDVRHCHGDLHLGNIFLDGEEPVLFDCIEFNDFYATIPPLYDLAFLLMDLTYRGERRFANRLLNRWIVERAGERWQPILEGLAALPLYLMLRAEIRAKTDARRPGGRDAGEKYFAQARDFAKPQPVRLIAIGGLSGTGKSSLAKALAWQTGAGVGAVHLRSDEIRKRLAGVPMGERISADSYTAQSSQQVYSEMIRLAGVALSAGQSVILDAVYAREEERTAADACARALGVAFHGFWLEAPAHAVEARLAARRGDASDAGVEVYRQQLAYDLGTIQWQRLMSAGSVDDMAVQALRMIETCR